MRTIKQDEWIKLKSYHCDKGKHKFRINEFGITWCVICGSLGNYNSISKPLTEEDKLLISK